jgi:hypothetical protein
MERKVGVALVGCGRIAPIHAIALKELPFTEIVMEASPQQTTNRCWLILK